LGNNSDALPTPSSRANIVDECGDIQTGADMTPRIPENILTWLVDWSLATIIDNTMPPRDPNGDEDEDEEDDEDEERHDKPAVVREPEPDE
jgi:hypothetical protein